MQRRELVRAWRELGRRERYVWNKLLTGSFRAGASARLVVPALAEVSGVDEGTIAHRLMGAWEPTAEFFERLTAPDTRDADVSRPYPFYLAYPLEQEPATLGDAGDWMVEWKWDGIRAQLIRRAGRTFLWSRGEELLSGRFPEVEEAAALLPEGTVLDGELLPWAGGAPMPFAQMQRRIGRKTLGRKILSEVPVVLVAYDLLEERGEDLRARPFAERRQRLGGAARGRALGRPAAALAGRRGRRVAGGRARAGAGPRGRRRGAHAQAAGQRLRCRPPSGATGGSGRWTRTRSMPSSSMPSPAAAAGPGCTPTIPLASGTATGWSRSPRPMPGLSDEEIRRVDAFVRRHTLEKFGPVRTVKPELVFELAFEDIQRSTRHKSGIAVRLPRIARWRMDKRPEEADTLERVRGLIDGEEA